MKHINYLSIIRSHYPELFGIRKFLQRQKVKRIYRHTLPQKMIDICENDSLMKEATVKCYLKKWDRYLHPVKNELETLLKNRGGYDSTDILFCRLAYGFIPSEYFGFGFSKKTTDERKQYVSDLDCSAFGYSVNNIVAIQKVLNKGKSAEHFSGYLRRDFVVIRSLNDFDRFCDFVTSHPLFVKKKIFSCMGKGVELINLNTIDISSHEYFTALVKNGEWLLEEIIVQEAQMAELNSSSVNTVRCITLRVHNEIVVPWCILRIGRAGSFVDNAGAGGIIVGINVETGITETDGFDECGYSYHMHPDSKVNLKGFQLPNWDSLLMICKEAASKELHMGYLAWDMALTAEGWKLVEVNEVGQLILPQIVYQCGIKERINAYCEIMEKQY